MTYELGYSRYDWKNKDSANSRNGHAKKTVKSRLGDIELQIPRDTCGEFEPVIVKKNERRLTGSIEDNILGIYAKGMSNRDIYNSMRGMYGVKVSAEMVSRINRQDSARCPGVAEPASGSHISHTVLGRDGVSVQQDGQVIKKTVYLVFGVTLEGHKEVLGIWIANLSLRSSG